MAGRHRYLIPVTRPEDPADHDAAVAAGKFARKFAVTHFGLEPFLAQWDSVFHQVCD